MIFKLFHIKLKAGALQYTIFISVIIALLIFSFISLTYVQQQLNSKNRQFQNLIETIDEAFLSRNFHELPYNTPTELTTINDEKNNLKAIRRSWGIFDIVSLTGTRNKEIFMKAALQAGHQLNRPALYLQDENQPLVLVGNTKIEGNVYLPKQGVKRGTIAGNSYTNTQLVYGSTAKSSNRLPQLTNLKALEKMKAELLTGDFETLEDNMLLVNSFSSPTKILTSTDVIDLDGIQLTGNIIVYAARKIKVSKYSSLVDVILVAPEIEIEDNVKGNFQAIATREITVAKNCSLMYPTSLILLEKQKSTTIEGVKKNQISIAKGSDVKGVVAFISPNSKESYNTHIRIDEGATITGEVYCSKNLELQGTIIGSVYTRGFIANQFGSVYKNHIYDGKILRSNLPMQYAGLQFEDTNYKAAKWLNY